jgi:hypothetical protein
MSTPPVTRRSHKTPRRHAADVSFHLANAVRSVEAILARVREPEIRQAARTLRADLAQCEVVAQELRRFATDDQARRETVR